MSRLELIDRDVAVDERGHPWIRMRDGSWRPSSVVVGRLLPAPRARGYRSRTTEPEAWAPSGSVTPSLPDSDHGATEPDGAIGTVGSGLRRMGASTEPGSVGSVGSVTLDEALREEPAA